MAIELQCNWNAGFVMKPNETPRVGYLLNFEGLNMPGFLKKKDIEVFTPYENPSLEYTSSFREKRCEGEMCWNHR